MPARCEPPSYVYRPLPHLRTLSVVRVFVYEQVVHASWLAEVIFAEETIIGAMHFVL